MSIQQTTQHTTLAINENSQETISATAAALKHIKQALAKREGGKGVRLDVKTTGCSGKSYVVDYVDETQPDDLIFQVDPSVIVCVAPSVFPMVKGTQIDYVRKGLNASFEFNNPNVKGACGCGESFTL
jgi:iron-sulfur cluster assembly protein